MTDLKATGAEAIDAQAQSVQQLGTERVTLDLIKSKITSVEYKLIEPEMMTMAIVRMENGFIVIGNAAPADPKNFNEDFGRSAALDNAIFQLWPLEGYLLKEKLYRRSVRTLGKPAPGPF